MSKIKRMIFTLTILLFSQHVAGQYAVKQSVFGNGGSTITNSDYRLNSTLGQQAIGVTQNSNYVNKAGFWYQGIDLLVGIEKMPGTLPTEFRLEQNYPNPFNPTTTICFALPKPSSVKLTLFDILGREVVILVDEKFQPGEYKVVLDAKDLASGIYFYRIETEGFRDVKKIMVLK